MKKLKHATRRLTWIIALLASISDAAVISGPILNTANGHSYFLLSSNTWTAAEAEAVSLAGHLATVNDSQENAWICSTFSQAFFLWIGLNRSAENGQFVWSSGESVSYTNWFPGEPNNSNGNENYVEIYNWSGANFQWNDNANEGSAGSYGVHGVVEIPGQAGSPVSYQSFNGHTYWLKPWLGTNVALLTPTNMFLNADVMSNIVRALDKAYSFYWIATGREPAFYAPTTLQGRDTIAVVTNTCGAGCGYVGYNGIEIDTPFFNVLYNGVASNNQYDQVLFYELGRNFWFYGPQLAYKSPAPELLGGAFAIFMRFASMEWAGVQGAPFRGETFLTFLTTVTNMMDTYMVDPSLNWSNTFKIDQAPPNPMGLSAADCTASLLMRVGRDCVGPSFGTSFWRQVELRPAAATTQQAVDNFVLASCATASQNLCGIFSIRWKIPVSASALQEAQSRWGEPIPLRPALTISKGVGASVVTSWQSQVDSSYQLQTATNLQQWIDLGPAIQGNGGIRTTTNSTAGSSRRQYRLEVD